MLTKETLKTELEKAGFGKFWSITVAVVTGAQTFHVGFTPKSVKTGVTFVYDTDSLVKFARELQHDASAFQVEDFARISRTLEPDDALLVGETVELQLKQLAAFVATRV